MNSIVVTVAAGLIGSHTRETSLRTGHEFVGVDNFRTGRRENLAVAVGQPGFALCEADIFTPDVLDENCRNRRPEAIVHLAALVSVPESFDPPGLNFRLNVDAAQLIIDAARKAAVKRIVYASSAAVVGYAGTGPIGEDFPARPPSPYGAAKLASETLLLGCAAAFGLVARCQRYYNLYGPRQDPKSGYSGVVSKFIGNLASENLFTIHGDGAQTRDFVAVADVACANLLVATAVGLSSGVVNTYAGSPVSIYGVPQAVATHACVGKKIEYAPMRVGDVRKTCGNPSKAATGLGFVARADFQSGINELVTLSARAA